MANKLTAGDLAPDFTLEGTDGTTMGRRRYSLAEFRGRPVVLAFYPADNSPVCTVQLSAYNDHVGSLAAVGAQILALSPQSIESHEEFHKARGTFAFPLLADTDKAVGRLYDVLGPMGFYRRSLFVVDAKGMVSYAHRSVTSLSFQPPEAVIEAVRSAERG
jgi:peroxiredoxin Q/BCP